MLNISQVIHDVSAMQLLDNSVFFLSMMILFRIIYNYTDQKYLMSNVIILTLVCALVKTTLIDISDWIPAIIVIYMYLRRSLGVQTHEHKLAQLRAVSPPTGFVDRKIEHSRKALGFIEPILSRWFVIACIVKMVFIIMEY